MNEKRKRTPLRMRYQLPILVVANMLNNTAYRMFVAFMPALARGAGVTVDDISRLLTIRNAMGLLSPFVGSLADSRGRRNSLLLSMAIVTGALLLMAIAPSFLTLGMTLLLISLGKLLFSPSVSAFLGDNVPYSRRGLAMGLIEYGWAGAFFFGMPLVGWLIDRAGWVAPFPVLALLVLILGIVLWRIIPDDPAHLQANRLSMLQGLREVRKYPSALLGLVMITMLSGSNEAINIVYGRWMEDAYQLKILELAFTASLIGVAEFLGETLVAWLSDRLGKRWALMVGLFPFGLVCLLLPILGGSQNGALLWLFLFYLGFEYCIVSNIPLMSEQVPTARATFMALTTGASWFGRMLSSLIGPTVYVSFGIGGNVMMSGVMIVISVLLVIFAIRD